MWCGGPTYPDGSLGVTVTEGLAGDGEWGPVWVQGVLDVLGGGGGGGGEGEQCHMTMITMDSVLFVLENSGTQIVNFSFKQILYSTRMYSIQWLKTEPLQTSSSHQLRTGTQQLATAVTLVLYTEVKEPSGLPLSNSR